MVQPRRPLTIMPPQTRSTASINRDGINPNNSHPPNEGPTRSHSPSRPPLPLPSLPGRSTSFSSTDGSDDSAPSSIFDPPDRQSTVSSAMSTPPPLFDLAAWLAASRAQYYAQMHAWRQQLSYEENRFTVILLFLVTILLSVFIWSVWSPRSLDWTLDPQMPDFHVTTDAALLCHYSHRGDVTKFIPLGNPPPSFPPLLPSSSSAGSMISMISSSSSSSNAGEEGGSPGLLYGHARVGAIGHVHLNICLDSPSTGQKWWWPAAPRCNRTELFTLDPVLAVPTAKANRISFAVLAREERESHGKQALPLRVWRDKGDGSVVVRGTVLRYQ